MPLILTDGTTSYLYDDAGNPVEQVDAPGTALYYQHDQYGSTRLLTNAAGLTAATFTYDANGNLTNKTGTADTVLRWGGQAQDTDTGLYYLRARYYDPTTTQFLSVDPLAAITQAIYSYANNNPLNASDPLGLWMIGGIRPHGRATLGGQSRLSAPSLGRSLSQLPVSVWSRSWES